MITWETTAVCDGIKCPGEEAIKEKRNSEWIEIVPLTCKVICSLRPDNKLYLKMPRGWIRRKGTNRVFCPTCSKKLVN